MSGIQTIGSGQLSAPVALEVESNTKAIRSVVRSIDFGTSNTLPTTSGVFAIAGKTGTMAAGLVAASSVFTFTNSVGNVFLLKKILLSAYGAGTGFTAGTGKFDLIYARSYSVGDSGGTDLTPGGTTYLSQNRLRWTMAQSGNSGRGAIRIASTGALTAGTRTLDAQPIASLPCICSATPGTLMVSPNSPLWDERAGEFPLVFGSGDGVIIQATVTGTGTWVMSIIVKWVELVSY